MPVTVTVAVPVALVFPAAPGPAGTAGIVPIPSRVVVILAAGAVGFRIVEVAVAESLRIAASPLAASCGPVAIRANRIVVSVVGALLTAHSRVAGIAVAAASAGARS